MRLTDQQRRQLPLFEQAPDRRWKHLDPSRRGTKFTRLSVRSVLNSPEQTKMGFWSMNPYVGCEFGCSYCYARPTHRYLVERADREGESSTATRGNDPGRAFEEHVFVKHRADDVLLRTLRPDRIGSRSIVIGTATDPYQPAEKKFEVTRSLLARIAKFRELDIGIITKSPLITRDIELLQTIQRRSSLTVHVSLISVDPKIIQLFEARSPTPSARLRALGQLTAAGIHAGLIVAPMLPGVTDDTAALEAIMQEAQQAAARFVEVIPLRLYDECRPRYLEIIQREFPALAARYENAFRNRPTVPPSYRKALSARVRRLRRKYGLAASARECSNVEESDEAAAESWHLWSELEISPSS